MVSIFCAGLSGEKGMGVWDELGEEERGGGLLG